ncbi:MAG TPA: hypothetical protein VKD71_11220 [Gemmataceae bacterium]|nr:hypothetical protein [Gemmataceae bacterium]
MNTPIPQERLQELLLPILREQQRRYRKFRQVLARPATHGEQVVSVTSRGVETVNVATTGDVVVRNPTRANELYVVSHAKFVQRYTLVAEREDGWSLYDPVGEVFALEIEPEVISLLGCASSFEIMAPWNAPQKAQRGDFFVTPPCFSEVYGIGREEFFETYHLILER